MKQTKKKKIYLQDITIVMINLKNTKSNHKKLNQKSNSKEHLK